MNRRVTPTTRGIRFNRTGAGYGLNRVHTLWFTFMNAPNLPNINDRFDQMAAEIRRRITWYFGYALDERHPFIVEFQPAENRVGGSRQRTVQRLESVTGEFLMSIYNAILHSQESIDIEGFRVYFLRNIFFIT